MALYTVMIPYREFREYIVEADEEWGDKWFSDTFDKYVEDGQIKIEYKYGDYSNGKSMIKWRIPGTEKVRAVRYTGSSQFAMWWGNLTDELENEYHENDCEEEDEIQPASVMAL